MGNTMHVLVVGANGQLGQAVQAARGTGYAVTAWGHAEADIADPAIVAKVCDAKPDLLINCAAWTNVDGAEKEPDTAFATNCLGAQNLATACARIGATMVQVSTNEVFAGKPGRFYYEYDQPAPESVYARSKAAGEVAATRVLDRLYVVRVAWLFGPGGNNFPSKMVAAADRNGALRVVDEEIGNPTYAPDVATAILRLVETERYGIYHLVNQGHTSRFGLAQAVLEATGRVHVSLAPIRIADWPRPAPPPPHAVLVNQAAAALGITLRPWQDAVQAYVEAEGVRFGLSVTGSA
jgi:dTDP-4-dehydrorhamnose reductase